LSQIVDFAKVKRCHRGNRLEMPANVRLGEEYLQIWQLYPYVTVSPMASFAAEADRPIARHNRGDC
jgi:hypothetical protein